jgi:hypothetical protein
VRIARTIAALAVLGCAFGLGWAEERLLCRGESGYEIRRAYLLLEEERFSEEELRRVFAPYAESELNGESYVVATSDPRLHDEFVNPRWYLESVHTAFSSTPLLTDGPLAYFYRLGENAFFHYGRMRGESRWVVIRGEDVFNRRFGETRLRFVGQDFFQSVSERRCGRRMLVFVSTEANEDDLPEIARYYAGLARMSARFDFSIWSSLEGAATYRDRPLPHARGDGVVRADRTLGGAGTSLRRLLLLAVDRYRRRVHALSRKGSAPLDPTDRFGRAEGAVTKGRVGTDHRSPRLGPVERATPIGGRRDECFAASTDGLNPTTSNVWSAARSMCCDSGNLREVELPVALSPG